MTDCHDVTTLHRSRGLRVSDVRCHVAKRGLGAEEAAAAHSVVLPREGLFVRADGTERVVGDAATGPTSTELAASRCSCARTAAG